jgi:hypothetical protein
LEYKVCNQEGECWTHSDEQIRNAKRAGGFDWVGDRNSKTGLETGVIYDSEGNFAGAFVQTSHDNPIQRMVWGAAHTSDTWMPVIELITPSPIPGGSALGGLFKFGSGATRLVRVVPKARRALKVIQKLCFVAGTPILTDKGLKPIEEIKEGDKVLSYNEQTKQTEYKTVVQTMVREAEAGRILSLKVEGETQALGVTGEHPFYVRIHKARDNISSEDDDGKWIEAKDLRIGDEIRKADGTWAKVESVTQRKDGAKVYNFTVKGNHNYFVGQSRLLAHNDCTITTATGRVLTITNKIIKDMKKRGWTSDEILEAVEKGQQFIPSAK